jgi:hypothetical protein
MNLTTLKAADLKKILKLLERKEAILAKVAAIDRDLASFGGNETATPAAAAPVRKPRKARQARTSGGKAQAKPPVVHQRGQVKARILELLQNAGKNGIGVRDIATSLGATPGRVFVWFSSNKKSIKQIKKIGPGRYAWVA